MLVWYKKVLHIRSKAFVQESLKIIIFVGIYLDKHLENCKGKPLKFSSKLSPLVQKTIYTSIKKS
ncbi:hypothetical protein GCM10022395_18360 [Snuella lapsa]|uniref:Uncharacterized protein n=1 Tax=Snuella lapsa TaxID=870481 RepID=A0ABP6XN37_9FLAO